MAQLTGKAIVAVHHLSVHHDTAAHTSAQGNHDEILHTASHTVGHLADGGSVSVVGNQARNAELLGHHLSQGDGGGPGQVGSLVNQARVVVAVRSTDADAVNLAHNFIILHQASQFGVQLVDVVIEVTVFCCLDRAARNHIAASVHDTKDGVSTAHVDANYIRFCHDFGFVLLVDNKSTIC